MDDVALQKERDFCAVMKDNLSKPIFCSNDKADGPVTQRFRRGIEYTEMLVKSGCTFYVDASHTSVESEKLCEVLYKIERSSLASSIFKPTAVPEDRSGVMLRWHFQDVAIDESHIPNWLRLHLLTQQLNWGPDGSFTWDDAECRAPILRPISEKSVGSEHSGYETHARYTKLDRSLSALLPLRSYIHPFVLLKRKKPFHKRVSEDCRTSLCNFIVREKALQALPMLCDAVRDCAALLWDLPELQADILKATIKPPQVIDKGCRTQADIFRAVRERVRYAMELYQSDTGCAPTNTLAVVRQRSAPTTLQEARDYFNALVECFSAHEDAVSSCTAKIQWDVLYTSSDGRKLVVDALAAFAMLQLTVPPERTNLHLLSFVEVGAVGCLMFHEFHIPTGQMSTFIRPDLRLIPLWNGRSPSTRALTTIVDHFASIMFEEANKSGAAMLSRLERRLGEIGFRAKASAVATPQVNEPMSMALSSFSTMAVTPAKKHLVSFVFMPESWRTLPNEMLRFPFPSKTSNAVIKTCNQSAEPVIYKKLLESHAPSTGLLKPIGIVGCEVVLPFVSDFIEFIFSKQDARDGTMLHHWLCIVEGLQTIHSMGYGHCDIARRNVLRGKTQSFLIDFGDALPLTSELLRKDFKDLLFVLLTSIRVPDAFCVVGGRSELAHCDFVTHIKKFVGLDLANELIEVLSWMIRGDVALADVIARFKVLLNASTG
eukprot:TRINITY_DN1666_c0_g1_i2.p1 TRINITY_DN1666_c0_g1~~TRINITY_DN1666_c0_g1_i2.p1  ORF type:complete len:715 (+),score=90.49 TRINITY_DN1666_c0_g1_i2:2488-4632(+)